MAIDINEILGMIPDETKEKAVKELKDAASDIIKDGKDPKEALTEAASGVFDSLKDSLVDGLSDKLTDGLDDSLMDKLKESLIDGAAESLKK